MLLVTSSDEQGLAYVETANLDGERNLKLKKSKTEIKDLVGKVGVNGLKGNFFLLLWSKPWFQVLCLLRLQIKKFKALKELLKLKA